MKLDRYKVNEQFDSVQGEGILVGMPSTFIRLQGCPVGCPWCDSGPLADEIETKRRTNGTTANTWGPGGEWVDVVDIIARINRKHVIITGGEPTIWNLDGLIEAIREDGPGYTIQLETSGLQALKGRLVPDWVTWSPKQNLDFQAPMALKNIVSEVKFVVDQFLEPKHIQKVIDYYFYENNLVLKGVVLMPEGCPPGAESIARTLELMNSNEIDYHGYQVRMGARLQYYLNMR